MKRALHVILVGLFIFLVFGSILVDSVAAKEQGPFVEFKLTADDAPAIADYGRSVAIDGDLVVVGAGADHADGAVYIYKRQGMIYVPEVKLVVPDASEGAGAEFGRSVAIQGNTVFIGARFAQVGDVEDSGAVYVYKKYKGSWHWEDKIIPPDPESNANFGRALAVQGDLLVVTARKSSLEEGIAYLYVNKGGIWEYTTNLTASDAAPGAYFGQSVALQGNLMAIGARNAGETGALYVFRYSKGSWDEIAIETPPDGNSDDQFGFAVAVTGDAIAVGARTADPDGLEDAGAAYLYSVKGDKVELINRLSASDAGKKEQFGQSVAFAGDVLAVGARRDNIGDNNKQGSIYLFSRMCGQWIETGKITASDGAKNDEFGYSLAAFGNSMVTGAHFADSTGVAYVLPLKV